MTTKKKESSVWATLSKVNCNKHVKGKNGLNYLSWAWAYGILMEHYPDATYEFREFDGSDVLYYKNGTGSVHCSITIEGKTKSMWLAIFDYKNAAIVNPSSVQIANSKMRCLTKCMAMFGLGHYIYANEDLPQDLSGNTDKEKEAEIYKLFEDASQLTKLESIVKKKPYNTWINSIKTTDEPMYFRVHEQYDLRKKTLTEGIKSNGQ